MKYKALATDLAHLIDGGQLSPGMAMPSVREISSQRGVSPVTVLKAYHLLESRGLITAQSRSGFYVAQVVPQRDSGLSVSRPSRRARAVRKADFIHEILLATKAKNVIPLGSAFPSPLLFPLKRINRCLGRAMKHADPWRTVTDLTPGSAELRERIALRYQIAGMGIRADDIVITDGAMEALNLSLQAVARPGDSVMIESPTFYAALQALQRLGLKAIEVATDPERGIDVDEVERCLQRQRPAACWIMSNFQNPTGASMRDCDKSRLVALLAEHGIPLIEDDTYGEIFFSSRRPKPAKAFDLSGRVLHCGSFSKCLAPGYRVGWAIPGQYVETVQRLKWGMTLTTSLPAQLALEHYLSDADYDRHLKKFRATLRDGRDAMTEAVHRFFPDGTSFTQPDGGYFLWVELPTGISSLELHRMAMDRNISIAPGSIFSPGDDFSRCIRLNFAHPDDRRINRALKTLGQLAAQIQTTAMG